MSIHKNIWLFICLTYLFSALHRQDGVIGANVRFSFRHVHFVTKVPLFQLRQIEMFAKRS